MIINQGKDNEKLLIFDLDGTICDSIYDIKDALNFVNKKYGLYEFNLEEVRKMIGNGFHFLVNKSLENNDDKLNVDELVLKFEKKYLEILANKTQIYDGILDFLNEFSKNKVYNIRLAVLTNKKENATKKLMHKLGITKYFDFIAGDGTFLERKPSPLPVIEITKTLKIPLTNTVMIGDGVNDILVAKNSNIKSIWVSYGYSKLDEIKQYIPDFVINNAQELKVLILEKFCCN
ncbi:MAG: HAD-IA family hydrolase [Elusimicrobiota bacterium]|jgi:phosphoglycolate phosphatase|nr:HAD-IA family hydrolase [Elusimicrobiota bacterium]